MEDNEPTKILSIWIHDFTHYQSAMQTTRKKESLIREGGIVYNTVWNF